MVAAVVGFFVVLRGAAFTAHAVPNAAFAGAAGAGLIGVNALLGLGVFSLGGALAIGLLSRRGRHDAVTALIVALMLGLGALFLSWSSRVRRRVSIRCCSARSWVSAPHRRDAHRAAGRGLPRPCWPCSTARCCSAARCPMWREARGISALRMELLFLVLVALATTTAVPVVGALLMFSLMVGPPAAARALARRARPASSRSRSDWPWPRSGWRSPLPTRPTGRSASSSAPSPPPGTWRPGWSPW